MARPPPLFRGTALLLLLFVCLALPLTSSSPLDLVQRPEQPFTSARVKPNVQEPRYQSAAWQTGLVSGLVFDHRRSSVLYVSAQGGNTRLFRMDPVTGELVASLDLPGSSARVGPVSEGAVDDDYLYLCHYSGHVTKVNLMDLTVVAQLTLPVAYFASGRPRLDNCLIDARRGYLYATASGPDYPAILLAIDINQASSSFAFSHAMSFGGLRGFSSFAIDEVANVAYVGSASNPLLLKVSLGPSSNGMEKYLNEEAADEFRPPYRSRITASAVSSLLVGETMQLRLGDPWNVTTPASSASSSASASSTYRMVPIDEALTAPSSPDAGPPAIRLPAPVMRLIGAKPFSINNKKDMFTALGSYAEANLPNFNAIAFVLFDPTTGLVYASVLPGALYQLRGSDLSPVGIVFLAKVDFNFGYIEPSISRAFFLSGRGSSQKVMVSVNLTCAADASIPAAPAAYSACDQSLYPVAGSGFQQRMRVNDIAALQKSEAEPIALTVDRNSKHVFVAFASDPLYLVKFRLFDMSRVRSFDISREVRQAGATLAVPFRERDPLSGDISDHMLIVANSGTSQELVRLRLDDDAVYEEDHLVLGRGDETTYAATLLRGFLYFPALSQLNTNPAGIYGFGDGLAGWDNTGHPANVEANAEVLTVTRVSVTAGGVRTGTSEAHAPSGAVLVRSGVLRFPNDFSYRIGAAFVDPAAIIKAQLDGDLATSGAIPASLSSSSDSSSSAAPVNSSALFWPPSWDKRTELTGGSSFVYFSACCAPGVVIRINTDNFPSPSSWDYLLLNSGENCIGSTASDLRTGIMYMGVTSPGSFRAAKVVMVDASTFKRIGSITLPLAPSAATSFTLAGVALRALDPVATAKARTMGITAGNVYSLFLDSDNGYGFAVTDTNPAAVVRFFLSNSTADVLYRETATGNLYPASPTTGLVSALSAPYNATALALVSKIGGPGYGEGLAYLPDGPLFNSSTGKGQIFRPIYSCLSPFVRGDGSKSLVATIGNVDLYGEILLFDLTRMKTIRIDALPDAQGSLSWTLCRSWYPRNGTSLATSKRSAFLAWPSVVAGRFLGARSPLVTRSLSTDYLPGSPSSSAIIEEDPWLRQAPFQNSSSAEPGFSSLALGRLQHDSFAQDVSPSFSWPLTPSASGRNNTADGFFPAGQDPFEDVTSLYLVSGGSRAAVVQLSREDLSLRARSDLIISEIGGQVASFTVGPRLFRNASEARDFYDRLPDGVLPPLMKMYGTVRLAYALTNTEPALIIVMLLPSMISIATIHAPSISGTPGAISDCERWEALEDCEKEGRGFLYIPSLFADSVTGDTALVRHSLRPLAHFAGNGTISKVKGLVLKSFRGSFFEQPLKARTNRLVLLSEAPFGIVRIDVQAFNFTSPVWPACALPPQSNSLSSDFPLLGSAVAAKRDASTFMLHSALLLDPKSSIYGVRNHACNWQKRYCWVAPIAYALMLFGVTMTEASTDRAFATLDVNTFTAPETSLISFGALSLSSDGRHLYAAYGSNPTNLMRIEAETGLVTAISPALLSAWSPIFRGTIVREPVPVLPLSSPAQGRPSSGASTGTTVTRWRDVFYLAAYTSPSVLLKVDAETLTVEASFTSATGDPSSGITSSVALNTDALAQAAFLAASTQEAARRLRGRPYSLQDGEVRSIPSLIGKTFEDGAVSDGGARLLVGDPSPGPEPDPLPLPLPSPPPGSDDDPSVVTDDDPFVPTDDPSTPSHSPAPSPPPSDPGVLPRLPGYIALSRGPTGYWYSAQHLLQTSFPWSSSKAVSKTIVAPPGTRTFLVATTSLTPSKLVGYGIVSKAGGALALEQLSELVVPSDAERLKASALVFKDVKHLPGDASTPSIPSPFIFAVNDLLPLDSVVIEAAVDMPSLSSLSGVASPRGVLLENALSFSLVSRGLLSNVTSVNFLVVDQASGGAFVYAFVGQVSSNVLKLQLKPLPLGFDAQVGGPQGATRTVTIPCNAFDPKAAVVSPDGALLLVVARGSSQASLTLSSVGRPSEGRLVRIRTRDMAILDSSPLPLSWALPLSLSLFVPLLGDAASHPPLLFVGLGTAPGAIGVLNASLLLADTRLQPGWSGFISTDRPASCVLFRGPSPPELSPSSLQPIKVISLARALLGYEEDGSVAEEARINDVAIVDEGRTILQQDSYGKRVTANLFGASAGPEASVDFLYRSRQFTGAESAQSQPFFSPVDPRSGVRTGDGAGHAGVRVCVTDEPAGYLYCGTQSGLVVQVSTATLEVTARAYAKGSVPDRGAVLHPIRQSPVSSLAFEPLSRVVFVTTEAAPADVTALFPTPPVPFLKSVDTVSAGSLLQKPSRSGFCNSIPGWVTGSGAVEDALLTQYGSCVFLKETAELPTVIDGTGADADDDLGTSLLLQGEFFGSFVNQSRASLSLDLHSLSWADQIGVLMASGSTQEGGPQTGGGSAASAAVDELTLEEVKSGGLPAAVQAAWDNVEREPCASITALNGSILSCRLNSGYVKRLKLASREAVLFRRNVTAAQADAGLPPTGPTMALFKVTITIGESSSLPFPLAVVHSEPHLLGVSPAIVTTLGNTEKTAAFLLEAAQVSTSDALVGTSGGNARFAEAVGRLAAPMFSVDAAASSSTTSSSGPSSAAATADTHFTVTGPILTVQGLFAEPFLDFPGEHELRLWAPSGTEEGAAAVVLPCLRPRAVTVDGQTLACVLPPLQRKYLGKRFAVQLLRRGAVVSSIPAAVSFAWPTLTAVEPLANLWPSPREFRNVLSLEGATNGDALADDSTQPPTDGSGTVLRLRSDALVLPAMDASIGDVYVLAGQAKTVSVRVWLGSSLLGFRECTNATASWTAGKVECIAPPGLGTDIGVTVEVKAPAALLKLSTIVLDSLDTESGKRVAIAPGLASVSASSLSPFSPAINSALGLPTTLTDPSILWYEFNITSYESIAAALTADEKASSSDSGSSGSSSFTARVSPYLSTFDGQFSASPNAPISGKSLVSYPRNFVGGVTPLVEPSRWRFPLASSRFGSNDSFVLALEGGPLPPLALVMLTLTNDGEGIRINCTDPLLETVLGDGGRVLCPITWRDIRAGLSPQRLLQLPPSTERQESSVGLLGGLKFDISFASKAHPDLAQMTMQTGLEIDIIGVPFVSSISPNKGPAGTTVTLRGGGFSPVGEEERDSGRLLVLIGESPCLDVQVIDDSSLTCEIPPFDASAMSLEGAALVSVITLGGSSDDAASAASGLSGGPIHDPYFLYDDELQVVWDDGGLAGSGSGSAFTLSFGARNLPGFPLDPLPAVRLLFVQASQCWLEVENAVPLSYQSSALSDARAAGSGSASFRPFTFVSPPAGPGSTIDDLIRAEAERSGSSAGTSDGSLDPIALYSHRPFFANITNGEVILAGNAGSPPISPFGNGSASGVTVVFPSAVVLPSFWSQYEPLDPQDGLFFNASSLLQPFPFSTLSSFAVDLRASCMSTSGKVASTPLTKRWTVHFPQVTFDTVRSKVPSVLLQTPAGLGQTGVWSGEDLPQVNERKGSGLLPPGMAERGSLFVRASLPSSVVARSLLALGGNATSTAIFKALKASLSCTAKLLVTRPSFSLTLPAVKPLSESGSVEYPFSELEEPSTSAGFIVSESLTTAESGWHEVALTFPFLSASDVYPGSELELGLSCFWNSPAAASASSSSSSLTGAADDVDDGLRFLALHLPGVKLRAAKLGARWASLPPSYINAQSPIDPAPSVRLTIPDEDAQGLVENALLTQLPLSSSSPSARTVAAAAPPALNVSLLLASLPAFSCVLEAYPAAVSVTASSNTSNNNASTAVNGRDFIAVPATSTFTWADTGLSDLERGMTELQARAYSSKEGNLTLRVSSATVAFPSFSIAARRFSSFQLQVICSLSGAQFFYPLFGNQNGVMPRGSLLPSTPDTRLIAPESQISGCPPGKELPAADAMLCSDCVSADGSASYSDGGTSRCQSCPRVGASCALGRLALLEGFYRPPDDLGLPLTAQSELWPCFNSEACLVDAANRQYGCNKAAGYADLTLAPLCGVCESGFTMIGKGCVACASRGALVVALLLLLALVTAGIIAAARWPFDSERIKLTLLPLLFSRPASQPSPRALHSPSLLALSQLVDLLQLLSVLAALRLPALEPVRRLFGWSELFNSQLLTAGQLACLFDPATSSGGGFGRLYVSRMVAVVWSPFLLSAAVVAGSFVLWRCSRGTKACSISKLHCRKGAPIAGRLAPSRAAVPSEQVFSDTPFMAPKRPVRPGSLLAAVDPSSFPGRGAAAHNRPKLPATAAATSEVTSSSKKTDVLTLSPRQRLTAVLLNALAVFTFLAAIVLYLPMVSAAMRALDCGEARIGGRRYLVSDLRVECAHEEGAPRERLAIATLVLLCGFLPVVMGLLLAYPLTKKGQAAATPQWLFAMMWPLTQGQRAPAQRLLSSTGGKARCSVSSEKTVVAVLPLLQLLRRIALALIGSFMVEDIRALPLIGVVTLIFFFLHEVLQPFARFAFNQAQRLVFTSSLFVVTLAMALPGALPSASSFSTAVAVSVEAQATSEGPVPVLLAALMGIVAVAAILALVVHVILAARGRGITAAPDTIVALKRVERASCSTALAPLAAASTAAPVPAGPLQLPRQSLMLAATQPHQGLVAGSRRRLFLPPVAAVVHEVAAASSSSSTATVAAAAGVSAPQPKRVTLRVLPALTAAAPTGNLPTMPVSLLKEVGDEDDEDDSWGMANEDDDDGHDEMTGNGNTVLSVRNPLASSAVLSASRKARASDAAKAFVATRAAR